MLITAGIDVGSSAVKTALLHTREDGRQSVVTVRTDRIRRRDVKGVVTEGWQAALASSGINEADVAYVASTGDGDVVTFRRGHFYGMTTHARGAAFLLPGAAAVLDIGALHGRAMRIDHNSRVLAYRMTSQCASGSGQFLENVARYLGVALEDAGRVSREADDPQQVSSICAVLAETDVINMVSRGISTANIIKGIHLSMAGRFVKLLQAIGARDAVLVTGGLTADEGLAAAMRERVAAESLPMSIHVHPHGVYAGALGAALWGAHRHQVLARRAEVPA
jgi:benzoyl-CoA reductase subunit D